MKKGLLCFAIALMALAVQAQMGGGPTSSPVTCVKTASANGPNRKMRLEQIS
jgi:hypothetical protein